MNKKNNKIESLINKSAKYVSVLFLICSANACSQYMDYEPEFKDNEIYGLWTDTTTLSPVGKIVNSLHFRIDGTFVANNMAFGIYTDSQSENEMSYYTEEHGNYVQSVRNIYFVSKKTVQWDVANNQPPVSNNNEKVIFESCTYEIVADTLKISYITYPADTPELTNRTYVRKRYQPD